jgi:hypothetical protein
MVAHLQWDLTGPKLIRPSRCSSRPRARSSNSVNSTCAQEHALMVTGESISCCKRCIVCRLRTAADIRCLRADASFTTLSTGRSQSSTPRATHSVRTSHRVRTTSRRAGEQRRCKPFTQSPQTSCALASSALLFRRCCAMQYMQHVTCRLPRAIAVATFEQSLLLCSPPTHSSMQCSPLPPAAPDPATCTCHLYLPPDPATCTCLSHHLSAVLQVRLRPQLPIPPPRPAPPHCPV